MLFGGLSSIGFLKMFFIDVGIKVEDFHR